MFAARLRPWSVALALALVPATALAGKPPARLSLETVEPAGPAPAAPHDSVRPQYPPPHGLPMLITGVSVFVLGIPTTVVGAFVARSPESFPESLRLYADRTSTHAGLSFLIPGAAMLFLGATFMAVGAVRYERFQRWRAGLGPRGRVAPLTGRTPVGTWTAGVSVRF